MVYCIIAPLVVLEPLVKAVDFRAPVLVDCGVRRPEDVVKTLAHCADAVLFGRLFLEVVAAVIRRGVSRLLREFAAGLWLARFGAESNGDST